MRSFAEISFRLDQEVSNLWLFAAPPSITCEVSSPLSRLPDPVEVARAVAGSSFAAQIEVVAQRVLDHRFPLLGFEIETGADIDWSRDYVHGVSNPLPYFRRLPYLDFARVGDHKLIWELNRHQHFVLLAQAWLLTDRREYLDEVIRELEDWWEKNPFQRGINWTSALEVAFRALSWIWVYHLAGSAFEPSFRRRFMTEVYRHGRHLNANLSIYFSPNTHLLGEAVALHAIGSLFPEFPNSAEWRRRGGALVSDQMDLQVREDGSHFEQSSYYHVYAVDFFVFHTLLDPVSERYQQKLARMAGYLRALTSPDGRLPFLGDDDGGRLFHPYGSRQTFGRATLATCAAFFDRPEWLFCPSDFYEQAVWWLGPDVLRLQSLALKDDGSRSSVFFPDSGVAVMAAGRARIIVDAGPFGVGSGGHSHSDTLSLVVRWESEDVLLDPGTYTYMSDPELRNAFRGSAAHNTIRVNGRDQAIPAGPFRWMEPPAVQVNQWTSDTGADRLDATCRYGGIRHRRVVIFLKPDTVVIFDEVDAEDAPVLLVEQFWHPGAITNRLDDHCIETVPGCFLSLPEAAAPELSMGWNSPALGVKEKSPIISVSQNGPGAVIFGAVLRLGATALDVQIEQINSGWQVVTIDRRSGTRIDEYPVT